MSVSVKERRFRILAAGAVVTALCVTGCSGPIEKLTYQGTPVEDAADSLATMTERWRSLMTSEDVEVSIPEDAQCYLQVAEEEMVGEELLCGPLAFMGAEETQWTVAPLGTMQTKDGGVRLVLEEDTLFDFGTANPNAVPLDAEGEEADLDQEVQAPSAPLAEMGDVIPLQTEEIEAAGEPYELVTVDATYTITTMGAVQQVGPPTAPTGAPEGGSLVTVGVHRQAHDGVPTSPTSAAVLTVGGTEHKIPEQTSAIAVEGDGSDAVVAVDYDGNVQEYSLASGELVSGRPFAVEQFAAVNAPESELIGDESNGASTSYRFQLSGGTSSWSEEGGWAPEGKDRLYLDLSFTSRTSFSEGSYDVDYNEEEYSFSSLTVTADGEEIPVDLGEVEISPRADDDYQSLDMVAPLVLEVPSGTEEVTVSASVDVIATLGKDDLTNTMRDYVDGEPESISETIELTEVTLRPQE